MSYNGSGTFLINTAGQPVVTGTVISSTTFNTLTADLGTGLSTAITKDGQTTTTSRIPFIAGISSTLTTDSTSVGTGSIITSGGVGIAKALFVGTTANIAGAVTLGGAVAITSASANALAVGLNGATNPAFNVDASTASSATGLNVKSAAAAGGVAVSVSSSGANEALTLNAKGTGTIGIGSVSTGAVTITPATTVTGAATLSSTLGVTGAATLSSTLDVTGVASFAAGSAALPSITRTGDLDTGVWFPAANTLGFSTSGSERARLDSGGILGIGVTPSAWGGVSANSVIQIRGASFFGRTDNSDAYVGTNFYRDSSNIYTYINTAAAAFLQLSGNAFNFAQAASGTAGNPITFTTKMTLDASGNLGIGTTDTGGKVLISKTTVPTTYSKNTAYLQIGAAEETTNGFHLITFGYTTSSNTFQPAFIGYTETSGSGNSTGALIFGTRSAVTDTTPAERMRIDSSGDLLVGTSSALTSAGRFQVLGAATTVAANIQVGTNGYAAINFNNAAAAQQGYIVTNATSVAYTSVSDYRLKNTIAPMTGALAKVALLKPCTYKWNVDGSNGEGFIAHELAEVCPHAVTGEKDAVNEDGSIKSQGIDTSFLVATLTAAIQELNAKFDAYVTAHP